MNNDFYVSFPLNFLSLATENHKVIDKILDFVIIEKMGNQPIMSTELFINKVLYNYYRKRTLMQQESLGIIKAIYTAEDLFEDGDYNGIISAEGEFNPTELDDVVKHVKNHPEKEKLLRFFEESSITFQYVKHKLGIKGGDLTQSIENHSELQLKLEHFIKDHGKDAYTSIKLKHLFQVRRNELPIAEFLFLCSIKSIIGKRNYTWTTKAKIVERACGAKMKKVLESINNESVNAFYDKYIIRYHFDKTIKHLTSKGLLTKQTIRRGFYVSTALDADTLKRRIMEQKDKWNAPLLKERLLREELRQYSATQQQQLNNTTAPIYDIIPNNTFS